MDIRLMTIARLYKIADETRSLLKECTQKDDDPVRTALTSLNDAAWNAFTASKEAYTTDQAVAAAATAEAKAIADIKALTGGAH